MQNVLVLKVMFRKGHKKSPLTLFVKDSRTEPKGIISDS